MSGTFKGKMTATTALDLYELLVTRAQHDATRLHLLVEEISASRELSHEQKNLLIYYAQAKLDAITEGQP
jgi:hypothetical protein